MRNHRNPDGSEFQSTLSMRRATRSNVSTQKSLVFQSTLSMRRATLHHVAFVHDEAISIHALHEESDVLIPFRLPTRRYFNPRSP